MDRIGIITFHDADNVGAVLQAYALQEFLSDHNDVKIIDYSCECIEETKKSHSKGIKGILLNIYYDVKAIGFDKFRKQYLKCTRKYNRDNIYEANNDFDSFVTGSDQVWNLSCSGDDYTYFLDFVNGDKKKYSYAASLGVYKYSQNEIINVTKCLENYSSISVREKSAVSEIEKCKLNKNIVVCLDPVFLLRDASWKKIMSSRMYNGKYVFVYLIQDDVNVQSSAYEYAKANNLRVINNKKDIKFMLHNSPNAFLSWIYNAEAVFTNSFHGTAFSLIFNKPLAADIQLKNGGINNRVNELLSELGALDCIIDENSSTPVRPNIHNHIEEYAQPSKQYLNNI